MAENTLPADLGRVAYEAETAWLDEIMPGARTPSWDDIDPDHRGVYQRIAGAVQAAGEERVRRAEAELAAVLLAVRQSCACPSCRSFIAGVAGTGEGPEGQERSHEKEAGPQSTVGDTKRALAGLLGISPAAILHFAAAIDTEAGLILQFCCDDRRAAAGMYADAARGVLFERGEPLHEGGPVPGMPGEGENRSDEKGPDHG